MLPRTSPFRNVLMLVGLGACFVLASVASTLIGGADRAASPVDRLATASPKVDPDAAAIMAMRPYRLQHTVTPVRSPSLKEILDSVLVLADAGLIAPLGAAPFSDVAAAVATPTATPAPMRQHLAPTAPADAAPAEVQASPTNTPSAPPPPSPPSPTVASPVLGEPDALPPSAAWEKAAYTQAVRDAVNAIRASAGLPPLMEDAGLNSVAAGYAHTLADARWFSHTGPDGSTLGQRLAAAGISGPAGEVLAMGSNGWSPAAVAQAWLDSAPHRAIILGAYGWAGLACVFNIEEGHEVVRCVMVLAA